MDDLSIPVRDLQALFHRPIRILRGKGQGQLGPALSGLRPDFCKVEVFSRKADSGTAGQRMLQLDGQPGHGPWDAGLALSLIHIWPSMQVP